MNSKPRVVPVPSSAGEEEAQLSPTQQEGIDADAPIPVAQSQPLDELPAATAMVLEVDGVPATRHAPVGQRAGAAAEVHEQLARLEQLVEAHADRLLQTFQEKLAYDASKQIQIDRLHEELQQYRMGLVARNMRPLVLGIIRLHDDMGRLLNAMREKPAEELTPKKFFSLLEGLQEDVEILLGQNGIAVYRDPPGPFNPRRQKVLTKVRTEKELLSGMVAQSLRPGFEQGEEIVEKERVAVHEFVPPAMDSDSMLRPENADSGLSYPGGQQKEN
jgi:molecular chaperone GrpE (heat shock protein)